MNQCTFLGRLTRDPEVRVTQSGRTATKFSLAVNRRFDRDKADFIKIECWGKLAEIVGKYTVKGSQVIVSGELHINEYEGRWFTTINADTVEFVGKRKAVPQANNSDVTADDIPF